MAEGYGTGEIVKHEFSSKPKGGRSSLYKWDELMDGQARKLTQGKDFKTAGTFKTSLANKVRDLNGKEGASKKKLLFETIDPNTVIVQVVDA